MRQMSIDMIRQTPTMEETSSNALERYKWPGNVREIKNVVQGLLFREENIITPEIISKKYCLFIHHFIN